MNAKVKEVEFSQSTTQARLTELETKSSAVPVITAEAPDPAVAAEADLPTEVIGEASKEPTAATPTIAEEKTEDEELEEAKEDTAEEAKDVTKAVTELNDAAAATKPKLLKNN